MSYLIYGAYGYTGDLIAREAVDRGHEPVLAGRDGHKLTQLADELGLDSSRVALSEGFRLRTVLEEVSAVVHCAGPFSQTAFPMVEACLDTGTHYLDITGELDVYSSLLERDSDAESAGVMLLPGVGFDVVPTDCLAAFLSEQTPNATELEIAFMAKGDVSKGTLKTVVEHAGSGGCVRRQGEVVQVPPGWSTRSVNFGDHPRTVISIPWGDIVTAGHSTGIPNVTVYTYVPRRARQFLRLTRFVQGLLGWHPVQILLKTMIDRWIPNPSTEDREVGRTAVWAAVRNEEGQTTAARIHGPEVYTFTSRAAVLAAERVLSDGPPTGYHTPATAFGSDFVLEVEGVERHV